MRYSIMPEQMNFDYNLIKYLVAIIETKSMTGAADVLDVAPSAVSYAVAKLRKSFNDPLFIRTINGVTPTAVAINLYERFKPILDAIVDVSDGKNTIDDEIWNKRKVIIRTEPLSEFWVSHQLILSGIIPNECNVEFVQQRNDPDFRVSKIRNLEVDIDIGMSLYADRTIRAQEIFKYEVCIIANKAHPRIGDSITLDEFRQEKFVRLNNANYNLNIISGIEHILLDHVYDIHLKSESMINLLLLCISYDYLTLFPRVYLPLVCELFPIKEVRCDFLQKKNFDLYAHIHSKNKNDMLLNKIISVCKNLH
ncbi:LysR family transcriptional regulator [Citrobacter amalonaticus]|uniref:LysR family transcriptional regulator n=1 Tax=Citrobacter amalonaticus TaxID=35703 RepID=UPI00300C041C